MSQTWAVPLKPKFFFAMAIPRLPGRRSTFVHRAVPCLSVPHQQAVHHVVGKPPEQQRQGGGWGGCCALRPRNYFGRWQNVNDSGKGWGWGCGALHVPFSPLTKQERFFFPCIQPVLFPSSPFFFLFLLLLKKSDHGGAMQNTEPSDIFL